MKATTRKVLVVLRGLAVRLALSTLFTGIGFWAMVTPTKHNTLTLVVAKVFTLPTSLLVNCFPAINVTVEPWFLLYVYAPNPEAVLMQLRVGVPTYLALLFGFAGARLLLKEFFRRRQQRPTAGESGT